MIDGPSAAQSWRRKQKRRIRVRVEALRGRVNVKWEPVYGSPGGCGFAVALGSIYKNLPEWLEGQEIGDTTAESTADATLPDPIAKPRIQQPCYAVSQDTATPPMVQ